MANARTSGASRYAWLILVATVLLVVFFRLRLIDLPLERDEGEFALMGQMILDGTPPYGEAYNLKPPGIYLAYAGVMAVFGQSPSGIHAGLLGVNLLCALFLFFIVRVVRGEATAAMSTAAFVALSSMPKVLGLSAHATQFLLLPALWGIFLILRRSGGAREGGRSAAGGAGIGRTAIGPAGIGWAGFLMGVSFLIKQPGVFFILLGAAMLMWMGKGDAGDDRPGRRRLFDLAVYLIGAAVPVVASLLWLWSAGVFGRFWFWVVDYALKYGSQVGFVEGLDIAWSVGSSAALPALIVLAVAIVGVRSLKRDGATADERFFIIALLAASALAVAMGFHFRRHYFVLLLPAVSILFGLGIEWIGGRLARHPRRSAHAAPVAAIVAAIAIAHIVVAGWPVYLAKDANLASRAMFGTNPFVESPLIGEKIREMTGEGDRIAVVGSEPQIYFYAHRAPATGYLYAYSLVEVQPYAATMRDEMIAEIERSHPAVFVYVNHPSSWLLRPGSDRSIFGWAEGYPSREGYELAGIVEVMSADHTVSLWGQEAAGYTPRSPNFIMVWKRAS